MIVDLTNAESTSKFLNMPKEQGKKKSVIEQLGMDPEVFHRYTSQDLPTLPTLPPQSSEEMMDIDIDPLPSEPTQLVQTTPTIDAPPSTSDFQFTNVPATSSATPVAEGTGENLEASAVDMPIMTVNLEQALKSIFKENERFVCPFVACRKDYKYKSDCNKHVKLHFTQKVEYQCEKCGLKLGSAKGLLEHMHGMHIKGDFLYTCKCGKGYYYNSHFSCHKQVCTFGVDDKNDEEGDENVKEGEK